MSSSAERPGISVVVCTLNEQERLPRLLNRTEWADEVVVVDCGSTDDTVRLAREHGARVVEQEWLGFSAQKNLGAAHAAHDWILSLDADEVPDDALLAGIAQRFATAPDPRTGFVVDRRGDFLGEVLPNGARRRNRRSFVRLYHRAHGAWDTSMPVHEELRVPGEHVALPGLLLHENDNSVDELVALFNRYASVEADDLWDRGRRASMRDLLLRPAARFVWHFVVRGEYRLGRRGAAHAGIKALSETARYAKLLERELAESRSVVASKEGRR